MMMQMIRDPHRRTSPATVRAVFLAACLLASLLAPPLGLAQGAVAGSGPRAAAFSMYLPLVIRWGVGILPNHSWYVNSSGSLWIVGEVQNDTPDRLELVAVTANVYNGSGGLLADGTGYTDLDHLDPGDKTCFDILIGAEPENWATYEFEPLDYYTTTEPSPVITVLSDSGAYNDSYGWYSVWGQVRNDHGSRLEDVKVVGSVYTSSGRIVGCQNGYADPLDLDPGQVASVSMTFVGRDYRDVLSYRLQADGTQP
ncbi:MAG TPA: FxLYD domain-containing protein [Anaerolineae bacterium]|nr:FxLYD domain-containing protein [Anaerolineae bacterium]